LIALESKISEAKTKKNMLVARSRAAKANEEIQKTLGSIDTSSSMSAFERMEEKVMQIEARSQAIGEITGSDMERQFAALESGSDVDDELAMLKAQMSGGALPGTASSQPTLPQATTVRDSAVDAELEELRSKLKEL
jgi:phage shock protein A